MHDRFHDSAGVPWEGRQFQSNEWSGDDGRAPEQISGLLGQAPIDKESLIRALSGQRLLIPLIAELGEGEVGPHGQRVDKSADLAIVAVSTPDGKTAIPAFSSVAEMSRWNQKARPVPVSAEKVALAAASEGHERVVLDPAGAAFVIRRPALAALAQGLDWVAPHNSAEVADLVSQAVSGIDFIASVELLDGDPSSDLAREELLVRLGIMPGLSANQLQGVVQEFNSKVQTRRFIELVDSVALQLAAV
ncbi:SseB family protein [Aquiluna borgnonia]|uniref:SseB family protein n=1 Tax=Aquiluna borgnonia TaxID=2499157 RepID=A0A7D4TUC8_9MICO|nr:SseB family protein [Aquiluna borgnonia]QKJ25435.1 SseB family protein [Aquiluna borgnonia]